MVKGIAASSSADVLEVPATTIDTGGCWRAWFDGAALPNPGKIGIGVVLVSPGGMRSEKSSLMGCCGCNNEAELHALCATLDMAGTAGARRLIVCGDSDVALRYVRGPDSTHIDRLRALIADARERLRYFDDVQLLWVPRHRNAEADRLSRLALGLLEASPRPAADRRRRR